MDCKCAECGREDTASQYRSDEQGRTVCRHCARMLEAEKDLLLERKLLKEACYQAELEADRAKEAEKSLERANELLTGVIADKLPDFIFTRIKEHLYLKKSIL